MIIRPQWNKEITWWYESNPNMRLNTRTLGVRMNKRVAFNKAWGSLVSCALPRTKNSNFSTAYRDQDVTAGTVSTTQKWNTKNSTLTFTQNFPLRVQWLYWFLWWLDIVQELRYSHLPETPVFFTTTTNSHCNWVFTWWQ